MKTFIYKTLDKKGDYQIKEIKAKSLEQAEIKAKSKEKFSTFDFMEQLQDDEGLEDWEK